MADKKFLFQLADELSEAEEKDVILVDSKSESDIEPQNWQEEVGVFKSICEREFDPWVLSGYDQKRLRDFFSTLQDKIRFGMISQLDAVEMFRYEYKKCGNAGGFW